MFRCFPDALPGLFRALLGSHADPSWWAPPSKASAEVRDRDGCETVTGPGSGSGASSYQFPFGSSAAWLAHLGQHGFVVVQGVVDCAEVAEMEARLWDFLEEATEGRWKKDDPESWHDVEYFSKLGGRVATNGIVNQRGAGQNAASWLARTHRNVREVFGRIWAGGATTPESFKSGTKARDTAIEVADQDPESNLLTSFDGFNVMRPWMHGIGEKTVGGWLHVDQGVHSRGKQCVQGFLSLYAQDESTGGFVVVPGSHKMHDQFCDEVVAECKKSGRSCYEGDFLELPESHPMRAWPQLMVRCSPGDLVLWDSRAFHCNAPAGGDCHGSTGRSSADSANDVVDEAARTYPPKNRLLRAVLYICMTPRAWADEDTLADRREGYNIHVTTSHWPHKNAMGFGWAKTSRKLDWRTADEVTKALIGV